MDIEGHLAALQEVGDRLAAAARGAGLATPVPTCPGWSVRDLVAHVGGVHRWAASIVATGRMDPTDEGDEARFFERVPDDDIVEWFSAGHAALIRTLADADRALECWTFLTAPSPLSFWARRQAHETAIHCADAEAAARIESRFPIDLAVDGIDELLVGFFGRDRGGLNADPPVTFGFRTTDAPAAWTVHLERERREILVGTPAAADCTVEGPASDLYLVLWNRRPAELPVAISGRPELMDLWRQHARVVWA